MNTTADERSFECKPAGRNGYFFYHEGSREIPFYWEYGRDDVIVIARVDELHRFGNCPWSSPSLRFCQKGNYLLDPGMTCSFDVTASAPP